MRKFLIVIAAIYAMCSFASHNRHVASWPENIRYVLNEVEVKPFVDDDGWILIGEVNAHSYGKENIKCNLYVREIAHRLIYRIEYNGKFYSVTKAHPNDDKDHQYCFTLNEVAYWFEVQ